MRTVIALVVSLLLAPVLPAVAANENGAPPGMAGGLGERTCLLCHRGNAVNDPAGSLQLGGIPPSYSPGRTYVVTITLTRSDLAKAGFQIASRFAEGADQGKEAGTWEPGDERTKVVPSADGETHYAEHTRSGTAVSPPGTARWSVRWTAPASAGGRSASTSRPTRPMTTHRRRAISSTRPTSPAEPASSPRPSVTRHPAGPGPAFRWPSA